MTSCTVAELALELSTLEITAPQDASSPASSERKLRSTYRHDPSVRGRSVDTRTLSAPVDEWEAIDAAAVSLGVSRSKYIRDAIRFYRAGR